MFLLILAESFIKEQLIPTPKECKMKKGVFLSFEGIDGCGKTTQIMNLEDYLKKKDVPVITAREPGGTALGGGIRRMLKYPEETYKLLNERYKNNKDFVLLPVEQLRTFESEIFLFLAARAEFVNYIVEPNLNKGVSVIADRFADSTRAYQGGGIAKSNPRIIELINKNHDFILKRYWPDKTFFLDINYEVSKHRLGLINAGNDDFEKRKKDFFEGIIREYHNIAKENPKRVVVINGTKSIDDIFNNDILPYVNSIYGF